MRQCIRCKTEMVEELVIRSSSELPRFVITTEGLFGKTLGKVKAAVCPECGEISIYLDDTTKLRELE